MTGIEILQTWIIAFFTLALFSFLYKDNPIYKVAEHIFAGLSAGYYVGLIWQTVILQKVVDPLVKQGDWLVIIPALLGLLMFARFFSKISYVSRVSLAFVMATTAGITLVAYLHGQVLPQMRSTMIANRDEVARVADPYKLNPGLITISDGSQSAQVLPGDEVDTALVQMPVDTLVALSDATTGVLAPDTSTQLVEVEPVEEDTLLAVGPSSISVSPSTLDIMSGDSVTIAGTFRPLGEDSPDLRWYRFGFRLKKPDIKREYRLADTLKFDDPGVTVASQDDGSYTVTYRTVLDQQIAAGTYDAYFEVQRHEPMWILTFIVVVGVLSTLIYFYFSHEHKGALGVTAKVGIWFIMISFGAHFGYTVMGRVSLLIGRVQFLIEDWIGSFSQLF